MIVRIQVVDSFSRCTTFRVKEKVVSTLLAYQSFPYRIAREGPNRVVGRRWRKGSARWRKDVVVGQRVTRARERVLSVARRLVRRRAYRHGEREGGQRRFYKTVLRMVGPVSARCSCGGRIRRVYTRIRTSLGLMCPGLIPLCLTAMANGKISF